MAYIKETKAEKLFRVFLNIFLIICAISMIYPFWHLFVVSVSSPEFVLADKVHLLPRGFNINAYEMLITTNKMLRSLWNTVFITVVGTFINVSLTVLLAYPLSKKYLYGKGLVIKIIIITMFFRGGMIPSFILVQKLNLINTLWALILPTAVSAFYLIIMINFFKSVPDELEEAAKIDGLGDLGILLKIYLPLSLHAIATITLFYSVMRWNTFMPAILYINDMVKYPLQVVLRQIVMLDEVMGNVGSDAVLSMPPESKKAATIIFTILPIICIYPFVQKYFIKGVMVGSVKG